MRAKDLEGRPTVSLGDLEHAIRRWRARVGPGVIYTRELAGGFAPAAPLVPEAAPPERTPRSYGDADAEAQVASLFDDETVVRQIDPHALPAEENEPTVVRAVDARMLLGSA